MATSSERTQSPRAAPPRFQGRVALVTGGGSGIGRAVAEALVREGAKVVLFGRTPGKLERLVASMPRGQAVAFAGCHERAGDARECVRQALARFARIDLLFNNAGTYDRGEVAAMEDQDWEAALARNLTGPFFLTREVLPAMRRQGGGVIVNNASTLGLRPLAGSAVYCVAKAGLVMLTRVTAREEARHGIRVCAVCPGVVDTAIHGTGQERAGFLERAAALHPLGRVGTPEDVAALVLFLASDAASWVTGAVVTADGGISLV